MASEVQHDTALDRDIVKHAAAGEFRKVLECIGFGGSPDTSDSAGRTSLHHAAERADLRAIVALLRAGASANARDRRGYTPLMLAARSSAPDSLAALLAGGADADAESNQGTTALVAACVWGRDRSVITLLDRTRRTNYGDGKCTPLHAAVLACSTSTVETLLDTGAAANGRDTSGDTPLHRVLSLGRERPDVVRVLLEHGADPVVRSGGGQTPSEIAAASGQAESAAVLATATLAITSSGEGGQKADVASRTGEERA